jgi:hypothetical protein
MNLFILAHQFNFKNLFGGTPRSATHGAVTCVFGTTDEHRQDTADVLFMLFNAPYFMQIFLIT